MDSHFGGQTNMTNDYKRMNNPIYNNPEEMNFNLSDQNKLYKLQIEEYSFEQWCQQMRQCNNAITTQFSP